MIHVFVHLFIYLIYLDWIKKKKYKILQLKLHWLPSDSLPSPSFTLRVLLWWDFFYPLSNWSRARDCFCSELHSSDVWQNMKPLTNKSSNNTRTRALKKPQINVSLNETIDWCTADLKTCKLKSQPFPLQKLNNSIPKNATWTFQNVSAQSQSLLYSFGTESTPLQKDQGSPRLSEMTPLSQREVRFQPRW